MATLTVQGLTTAGLNASFTAPEGGGDQFTNDGNTFVFIKNSGAATNTITIASQVSPVPKGLALADINIEVSANAEVMSGFFDAGAYNDSSGYAQISYAATADITIAAISVT